MIKPLVPGHETARKINALISLTDITSDDVKTALHDRYVKGHTQTAAAAINGLDEGNFSRTCISLEVVAAKVEICKEEDWSRFGYKSPSLQQPHTCEPANKEVAA